MAIGPKQLQTIRRRLGLTPGGLAEKLREKEPDIFRRGRLRASTITNLEAGDQPIPRRLERQVNLVRTEVQRQRDPLRERRRRTEQVTEDLRRQNLREEEKAERQRRQRESELAAAHQRRLASGFKQLRAGSQRRPFLSGFLRGRGKA